MLKTLIPIVAFLYVQAASNAPTIANLSYGPYSRNVLDLWQAKGETPRPLLIYIHGGGWVSGDKELVIDNVPVSDWLKKGVSVASINYRYDAKGTFLPAPVHDAARAVQFLRYKSEELNLDPSRFVLQGVSAGGCSALWILFHDDLADPASPDPVLWESSRVRGVYVDSAQTTIDPALMLDWIGTNAAMHKMIFNAVGAGSYTNMMAHYETYTNLFNEFSPIRYVDSNDPPAYLTYISNTNLPPSSLSAGIHHPLFGIKLKEQSEQVGYTNCFLDIPGTSDAGTTAVQFLEKILL